MQTKLALYSTYVVGGAGPQRSAAGRAVLGHRRPYHYLRVEPDTSGATIT